MRNDTTNSNGCRGEGSREEYEDIKWRERLVRFSKRTKVLFEESGKDVATKYVRVQTEENNAYKRGNPVKGRERFRHKKKKTLKN